VGEDRTGRDLDRALTVADAAGALGITQDAVRKRIRRGTIQSEKDESGRIYVYVPASETVHKTGQDTSQPPSDSAALISAKNETIAALRDQLEAERQAHAEARRIIAGLVERIPAIEAPSEARESPESSGSAGGRGEVWEELDSERARREMAESTLREGMAEEQRRREEAERERDDLRRELYALREPRESPETVEEESERAMPRPVTVESQESVQRPWWGRVFGR
jgi:chromosome segregation ATPase